ncbi:four helix bundle protein [Candidatus Falkowbacteria bacterium RIFOXYB2_FULL_38_15]|uniref:Four helix bundle protein n=1 Tax=Candidatus Falkowbacteria bacterium RIFOXYA2_FULL_38_12 TaxID=1797993 RepID=A0A1F5S3J2_9BACT|nr:MAG: four helix bundle protein [Candidatus Falkowbacteria bacterium RIFOXYA2_FULL_38_12]OGF32830.1 MAG: four helix bundle protein [Candidatus Falkowbacteria bacterium RIFOXYB2_FULL_38_15]OGF42612.1 MAG: four helix bundle protein [Candidatus Falkowbacteria bacterium RIFOXYD2_FULL_39_16]
MTEIQNSKHYDLEERTFLFARRVNEYINKLPKTITSIENSKQLARSAGSVGANYIEANESLSKKDFAMRVKISRKEAKESIFWLRLIEPLDSQQKEKEYLIQEATELMKIFGAILTKMICKT